jgi:hypothetical protein
LRYDVSFQTFTHQIVDVFPQKLHQQDKKRYEKSQHQRTKVGLNRKNIYFFQGNFQRL